MYLHVKKIKIMCKYESILQKKLSGINVLNVGSDFVIVIKNNITWQSIICRIFQPSDIFNYLFILKKIKKK
jgi:hypothetical protein